MKGFGRIALSAAVALSMLAMVPGAAFAAQPSCGDTLMANTTLTADLDCSAYGGTALFFGKKGITLNLGGHTLWGPVGADSYVGIDTNEKKHVTIKNGTIANFDEDIYANESVGGAFKNLTLNGEYPTDSDDYGIYVSYGSGNTLNNLTISDMYIGIDMYGATGTWVTNNNITASYYGEYDEYDSLDHFVNNYAEYSYAGFEGDDSGGQTFTNNQANGDASSGEYGFYFSCGDYGAVWATNNETWGNSEYGFYVDDCYNDSNNTSKPTLMNGNSSHDNSGDSAYGFYDDYSINATWTNNVAKNNEAYGFEMYEPGFVTFKNNVANHNGSDGIYVEDGYSTAYDFASFANNKANNNADYGIDGDYGIANASGNTAHGNGNAPDDCYNVECN